MGSVIGGFYWLFLWNFKEIKHQPFPMAQPYFYISNNEIQFLSHDVCRAKDWGESRIVTLLYEYANHILRQGAKPCSSMPKEALFRRRKNGWAGFDKGKSL